MDGCLLGEDELIEDEGDVGMGEEVGEGDSW